MTPNSVPELIIAGPLRMEYALTPEGKEYSRLLGGPCLYAGTGAKIWTPDSPGLIARVGNNFPAEALEAIRTKGLDTRGVRVMSHPESTAGFYCYDQWDQCIDWDPVKYYARRNLPCPPELLDYVPPSIGESQTSSFPDIAIRREDIPDPYLQARLAYIAPCHYLSQITLSVALRQSGVGTICLAPSKGMYVPSSLQPVAQLLHGIDIFFAEEENLRKLFPTETGDEREISEFIARMGPKIVLLQKELQGVSVYDSESKRLHFSPFYPVEIKNPIGVGDSFCGGFLAAWRHTYDPVESALHGCISASLAMEGMGGLFALDRNPALAEARLFSLRRSHSENYSA
jgi:sugar/nucleoside kinase (ribokinase family)